ncbi:MAG: sigma-70 family RNA polymerase sigma factor [Bacteriovorax sp.]
MSIKGESPSIAENGLFYSNDERELSYLMKLSQAGDGESYKLLLNRLQVMLKKFVENSFYRLGLQNTGGQEDVLQEVLFAIHSKRANYDPTQFFLPWMYAIARYKIIDFLRKNKVLFRSSVSVDDELANLEMIFSHDLGTNVDLEVLLKLLPQKQCDILKLVKIEGHSIQEVAKLTGYSASDIKVNVHRALKSLQEKMQKEI